LNNSKPLDLITDVLKISIYLLYHIDDKELRKGKFKVTAWLTSFLWEFSRCSDIFKKMQKVPDCGGIASHEGGSNKVNVKGPLRNLCLIIAKFYNGIGV